jgi:hypothetical protein
MRKAIHYDMIYGHRSTCSRSGRRRSIISHTPFSRYNAKLQNKPINSAHIVLQVPRRIGSAPGRHFITFKDGDGAQQEVEDTSRATCKVGGSWYPRSTQRRPVVTLEVGIITQNFQSFLLLENHSASIPEPTDVPALIHSP